MAGEYINETNSLFKTGEGKITEGLEFINKLVSQFIPKKLHLGKDKKILEEPKQKKKKNAPITGRKFIKPILIGYQIDKNNNNQEQGQEENPLLETAESQERSQIPTAEEEKPRKQNRE
ncbi:hypothetical protein Glove_97g42 [Diversispora epigaea]|uniref:Uncharacterized protein n=1 Tax=Diversispora epigaea TaxID=1348612 RepID=A0A397J8F6_9GLOM|nr:hypothetical protein Glove_97g42 [Diversispora epigaea]